MSESLFYNRDQNISGITVPSELSEMSFTPVYGSKVDFSANNHKYITDDFYYNLIPLSLNSLTAKFNVRYDVNESGARKLATFFESKEGFKPLKFTPDNLGIYKTVSGFCDNYAINFINNQHFEVAAIVNVDRAPTLLNWKNGNFANVPFQDWAQSTSYKKYDVTYYRFKPDGNLNGKLDGFYYSSGDHTSSHTNSPTGADSMWSQKFFFEPDIGGQNDVKIKADVLNYKNSFIQHLKTNDNIATFDMSYTYTDITDLQLRCMLHFLERKGGYRRFEHQIPSVYNRPKVYYCPTWSHTWTYFNSNNLTVDLMEDPLGIVPTSTFPWNVDAEAYFTKVEAHPTDPYTFTAVQKAALSDFFDALATEGLSLKIKKMWLVGFSVAAGLRDVINPTEVETWDIAPVAGDMHDGYATFSTENLITTSSVESLGLEKNDCGAFVTCTNMDDDATINYVNGYASSSKTFRLSQRKHTSGPPEEWEPWFRAGSSTYTKFRGGDFGTDGIHNGVFLASRKGDGVGDYVLTRIKGERVLEEGVDDVVAVGQTSDAAIILWGENTVGNVSSVGITSGLTETESATLAGLIYDLCVGIGHTDLITVNS